MLTSNETSMFDTNKNTDEHLHASSIRQLKNKLNSDEIIRFLTENKSYLRKQFHCSEIGLFGSYARNEQTDQSDIDILVVFEPETKNLYDVELKLKEYLQSYFNRDVDICSKKWIKPIFKPLVLKDAIYA